MKIARLLGIDEAGASGSLLEVGTGSGGISRYFGTCGFDVESVDVEDVRLARDGYRFTLVRDELLPFEDRSFDVVISNHVIEHVGSSEQQASHLAEMARVLRDDGVAYLAVPSRWMLVEPHFRLPFLSWLPKRAADGYVRLSGKGTHYDCKPLTVGVLEDMLDSAGFRFHQSHGDALRVTFELERPTSRAYRWVFSRLPVSAYEPVRRIFPTLIYVLKLQKEPQRRRTSESTQHVARVGPGRERLAPHD